MTEPLTPADLAALRTNAELDSVYGGEAHEIVRRRAERWIRLLDEHAALRERHERALALIAEAYNATSHVVRQKLGAVERILRGTP